MIKVANPIVQPVNMLMPSAKVVHGLTPAPAASKSASPRPNKTKPKANTNKLITGGWKVNAFGDLQINLGTCFIDKNCNLLEILI